MERFVQLVFAGGIALVVGLWALTLFRGGSGPWILGAVLSVVGAGALSAGIWIELEL